MSASAKHQGILAADGTPLKRSLARALRREKLRALLLVLPLLIFVLLTFIAPIANMLLRSVDNTIVGETIPYTVAALEDWDGKEPSLPPEDIFRSLYFDLFLAVETKKHTRLGSRLNYEQTGISSLFRRSGRKLDDIGKDIEKALIASDARWEDGRTWFDLFAARNDNDADRELLERQSLRIERLQGEAVNIDIDFIPSKSIAAALPLATREYTAWAIHTALIEGDDIAQTKPWESIPVALLHDMQQADFDIDIKDSLSRLSQHPIEKLSIDDVGLTLDFTDLLRKIHKDWGDTEVWQTIKVHSENYTSGYFLNSVDMRKSLDGPTIQPENKRILITLFIRTVQMSLIITLACILLGYPIAWLMANLPMRTANLLIILVLLPFWTSLLVRTSAWKVMLQQQGVINETLVWLGIVATDNRLEIINNQIGTITAMTHILLPFMVLPMYSVMQTISPSYVRAAKSLGASDWTAFRRVYFPQSIPGIGAGSILVFILSIGYYITPEIVGGTDGVFISNRIAYHISRSLNWGLAAALGTILLVVVLVLYWTYDRIVGIDNVKLG
ncbi:MAG: ABC transporter permease [Ectothiorhodospiraceae bacterium AqS1]|nr:ABC transporter permease [Ectothiorhodospiraceae bacterium AqS1]